jgi:5-methylcytosine-specific restriction enzyme A
MGRGRRCGGDQYRRKVIMNFSAKTRAHAWTRCKGKCERCAAVLMFGNIEFDHRIPRALGGGNDPANCMALCKTCHKAKTHEEDRPRIGKAIKQERAAIGAKRSSKPIQSRGFETQRKKPRIAKGPVPDNRPIYRTIYK